MIALQSLQALLGPRLRTGEMLAKYTAARLGGPADWLYIANAKNMQEELVQVLQTAWTEGLPVRVIGGGANILVSDKGFRGLVIINRISEIEFGDWHDGRNVSASGGVGLTALARMCATRGLSGLEWAISVPGTVGGAIVNNAGAHGSDISTNVADVVVLEAERGPQLYSREDLRYAYRASALKIRQDKRFIVLLATFRLGTEDPARIQARMASFMAYRKQTQPPGASLGSIFKNPSGDYAGRLIESCGLKGYRIGNVQVSPMHANFFVNIGSARASDYWALIQYVRQTVAQKTGVELELEIELLGDW